MLAQAEYFSLPAAAINRSSPLAAQSQPDIRSTNNQGYARIPDVPRAQPAAPTHQQMVEDEQMTEAKQQFAIEAFGLMALASVLYSSSK